MTKWLLTACGAWLCDALRNVVLGAVLSFYF